MPSLWDSRVKVPDAFLDGSETVLVAQVPKAGGRWHQVHMNADVMRQFFRLTYGTEVEARFERVSRKGTYAGARMRPVVYSGSNKNLKIEFELSDAPDYPTTTPPILLVLEVELRRFRYMLLLPGDDGYDEMWKFNQALEPLGKGLRRGVTSLTEIELRWPSCPLRAPRGADETEGS